MTAVMAHTTIGHPWDRYRAAIVQIALAVIQLGRRVVLVEGGQYRFIGAQHRAAAAL